jgi:imidazole glycerol phosphate synthase subunit HisF
LRIGASIIMKNGVAVQSYGWNFLRPLGDLQFVLDSLDEYECDEITLLRYARSEDHAQAYNADIDVLANCNTLSPLSFGGGIRSLEDLERIHRLPVERLVFSSALLEGNYSLIEEASTLFGHQAIQCLIPISYSDNEVKVFLPSQNRFIKVEEIDFERLDNLCNELIVYDTVADGFDGFFSFDALRAIKFPLPRTILMGGVGLDVIKRAKSEGVAAVSIDNRVLHKEYSTLGAKKYAGL